MIAIIHFNLIVVIIISFFIYLVSIIHDSNPKMPLGTLFIGFYYII